MLCIISEGFRRIPMNKMKSRIRISGFELTQILLCFFIAAGLASCKHENAHWAYGGDSGPEQWGDLSTDFQACKLGKNQSPIDISNAKTTDLTSLTLNYQDTPYVVENNGHSIQINLENAGNLTIGEDTYKLLQFHFHNPSEEAVDGQRFPLVAHFVHKSDAGNLAVIALFFATGKENALLKPVFSNLPAEEKESLKGDSQINPASILGNELAYYAYNGSLTTPPCSEGVRWIVLKKPTELSLEQLSAFKELYSGNARPLQPLNARQVLQSR